MKWLTNRLKEKSTWRGLVIMAGAFGLALDPTQIETVGAGVAAAIGVVETVTQG